MKSRSKLYLLLVLTISLSLAAFAPQTASGEAETNRPDKIDAALWDVMCASDGDEWIPIEISLYDLDENALFAKLKTNRAGCGGVRDEARFEKEVALKNPRSGRADNRFGNGAGVRQYCPIVRCIAGFAENGPFRRVGVFVP